MADPVKWGMWSLNSKTLGKEPFARGAEGVEV